MLLWLAPPEDVRLDYKGMLPRALTLRPGSEAPGKLLKFWASTSSSVKWRLLHSFQLVIIRIKYDNGCDQTLESKCKSLLLLCLLLVHIVYFAKQPCSVIELSSKLLQHLGPGSLTDHLKKCFLAIIYLVVYISLPTRSCAPLGWGWIFMPVCIPFCSPLPCGVLENLIEYLRKTSWWCNQFQFSNYYLGALLLQTRAWFSSSGVNHLTLIAFDIQ